MGRGSHSRRWDLSTNLQTSAAGSSGGKATQSSIVSALLRPTFHSWATNTSPITNYQPINQKPNPRNALSWENQSFIHVFLKTSTESSRAQSSPIKIYPFKYKAQTALFKDPVRTALWTLFISVIKNQSVYAVSGTSRCLFSDKYKTWL